jgi:hypothetical protein
MRNGVVDDGASMDVRGAAALPRGGDDAVAAPPLIEQNKGYIAM